MLHNVSVALRLMGQLDEAVGAAREAVRLQPVTAMFHRHLGVLLNLQGRSAASLEALRIAERLDPEHPLTNYFLSVVLLRNSLSLQAALDAHQLLEKACQALQRLRKQTPGFDLISERLLAELADSTLQLAQGEWKGLSLLTERLCSVPIVSEVLSVEPDRVVNNAEPTTDIRTNWSPHKETACRTVSPEEAARLVFQKQQELGSKPIQIVALTGAGLSRASGLETRKELWKRFSKDEAVSIWRFHQEPGVLWRVVESFLQGPLTSLGRELAPNPGHAALADLDLAAVLTQNVDDLHQRSSPNTPVVELHGSLMRVICHDCGHRPALPVTEWLPLVGPGAPNCDECCTGRLRPDVVLFGEQVARKDIAAATTWTNGCDILLVIGCAMDVYPAASLPFLAAKRGATVIEFNLHPSRISRRVGSHFVPETAEITLPRFARALKDFRQSSRRGRSHGFCTSSYAPPPPQGFHTLVWGPTECQEALVWAQSLDPRSMLQWPGMDATQCFFKGHLSHEILARTPKTFQQRYEALAPLPRELSSLLGTLDAYTHDVLGVRVLGFVQLSRLPVGKIKHHRDPVFYGDFVLTAILSGRSTLELRSRGQGRNLCQCQLKAGDGYVLEGPALTDNTHAIFLDSAMTRFSVTFRFYEPAMAAAWTSGNHSCGQSHRKPFGE